MILVRSGSHILGTDTFEKLYLPVFLVHLAKLVYFRILDNEGWVRFFVIVVSLSLKKNKQAFFILSEVSFYPIYTS